MIAFIVRIYMGKNVKASWLGVASYPILFVGYSWCCMAFMFFTPLFTIADVEVGRFQNKVMNGIWDCAFSIISIEFIEKTLDYIERKNNICYLIHIYLSYFSYRYR